MPGERGERMLGELVERIVNALGGQALRIVLYGSTARGTQKEESDVDVAVFVSRRLNRVEEDSLSDAIVDMNLKYDKVFSVIDIEDGVYRKWKETAPFYRNIEREGAILWTAA